MRTPPRRKKETWPETQLALAEVLGERGEGFIELSGATMPRAEPVGRRVAAV